MASDSLINVQDIALFEEGIRAIEALAARVLLNRLYNDQTLLMFLVTDAMQSRDTSLFTIQLLCNLGSDLSVLDSQGVSAMHMACRIGDIEVIRSLLRFGIISNKTVIDDAIDSLGKAKASYIRSTAKSLHMACYMNASVEVFKQIIAAGADHRANPTQDMNRPYKDVLADMFAANVATNHVHVSQINSVQDLEALFAAEGLAF